MAIAASVIAGGVAGQDQDTLWVRENLLKECKRKGSCWRYFHHQSWWWGRYGTHYRARYARYNGDGRDYDRDERDRRYASYNGHRRNYDRDTRDRRNDYYEDRGRYGYYSDAREHRLPKCRPWVSATGHEASGRPVAKEEAEQAWMEEVRGQWGARYMDVRNARDFSYECYRSSTGNRASEKASDLVGRVLEQCRVEGKPCLADKEFADEGQRGEVSRNMKEEGESRGSRMFRRLQEWRARRAQRRDRR